MFRWAVLISCSLNTMAAEAVSIRDCSSCCWVLDCFRREIQLGTFLHRCFLLRFQHQLVFGL